MAWTDESKKEAVALYLESNPTSENTTEIIEEIADKLKESVNGVRMILTQAKVYVKKTPAAATSSASSDSKASGEGTKRVSKEHSIAALTEKLKELEAPVDEAIIEKLTGKAAIYFLSVVNALKAD